MRSAETLRKTGGMYKNHIFLGYRFNNKHPSELGKSPKCVYISTSYSVTVMLLSDQISLKGHKQELYKIITNT